MTVTLAATTTTRPTATAPATTPTMRGAWRTAAGRDDPAPPDPRRRPQSAPGCRRTTRVVTSAQRSALAARDGGCVFPDCDRPLAWCEGHHLVHWLHGGPPTWPIWPCCAEPTIGQSTRAAGGWPAAPMGGSPPPHPPTPPTSPAPPATSYRGLSRLHPAATWAGRKGEHPHRARECIGPENPGPPCQATAWGPGPRGPSARHVHRARPTVPGACMGPKRTATDGRRTGPGPRGRWGLARRGGWCRPGRPRRRWWWRPPGRPTRRSGAA